jgi:hypothetical protein
MGLSVFEDRYEAVGGAKINADYHGGCLLLVMKRDLILQL